MQRILNQYPNYPTHPLYFEVVETPYSNPPRSPLHSQARLKHLHPLGREGILPEHPQPLPIIVRVGGARRGPHLPAPLRTVVVHVPLVGAQAEALRNKIRIKKNIEILGNILNRSLKLNKEK